MPRIEKKESNESQNIPENTPVINGAGETTLSPVSPELIQKLQIIQETFREPSPVATAPPTTPSDAPSRTFLAREAVIQQKVSVIEKLQKKASSGDIEAQAHLGHAFLVGEGVAANREEASRWLLMAATAKSEHSAALWARGLCLQSGIGDIGREERARAKALACFEKGANSNYPPALVSLARCYVNGNGVRQDIEAAIPFYLPAVKKGYAPAQSDLAWCYENGYGLKKEDSVDPNEVAARLYHLAADQGDIVGQFCLAKCYEKGRGVTKDLAQANTYYARAAEQGHEGAKQALKNLKSPPALVVG